MTAPPPTPDADALRQGVSAWFFQDYLPRWIANGSGRRAEAPAFILDYWHVPLLVATTDGPRWLADQDAVLGFLALSMQALRASHYDHSAVLDQRVRVYHARGAAIDIVWSRRRADGTETQRTAMHYELARVTWGASASADADVSGGWRVVAMQVAETAGTAIPW